MLNVANTIFLPPYPSSSRVLIFVCKPLYRYTGSSMALAARAFIAAVYFTLGFAASAIRGSRAAATLVDDAHGSTNSGSNDADGHSSSVAAAVISLAMCTAFIGSLGAVRGTGSSATESYDDSSRGCCSWLLGGGNQRRRTPWATSASMATEEGSVPGMRKTSSRMSMTNPFPHQHGQSAVNGGGNGTGASALRTPSVTPRPAGVTAKEWITRRRAAREATTMASDAASAAAAAAASAALAAAAANEAASYAAGVNALAMGGDPPVLRSGSPTTASSAAIVGGSSGGGLLALHLPQRRPVGSTAPVRSRRVIMKRIGATTPTGALVGNPLSLRGVSLGPAMLRVSSAQYSDIGAVATAQPHTRHGAVTAPSVTMIAASAATTPEISFISQDSSVASPQLLSSMDMSSHSQMPTSAAAPVVAFHVVGAARTVPAPASAPVEILSKPLAPVPASANIAAATVLPLPPGAADAATVAAAVAATTLIAPSGSTADAAPLPPPPPPPPPGPAVIRAVPNENNAAAPPEPFAPPPPAQVAPVPAPPPDPDALLATGSEASARGLW